MSTIGDRLGSGSRPDTGIGVPMAPKDIPEGQRIDYSSFSGGLILGVERTAVPANCAVTANDMQPDETGRLIHVPGVELRDASSRTYRDMFVQMGLDGDSTLLIVDPPYLGTKASFVGATAFTNVGIAATSLTRIGWVSVNYGDDILFSNGGTASYTRSSAGVLTDVSATIIARSFAAIFGRLFALAPTSGGVLQAMGIQWNGTSALITDWTGAGSGAELLIADIGFEDRGIAVRALGTDLLAILCRSSLWAGYPTQQEDRPADFRLRFPSHGCVSERTVCITPGGVTYLSDAGVCNYNVSQVEVISQAINSELLPLTYGTGGIESSRYRATYDPTKQRYILVTPTCTYIYEFAREGRPARWTRRWTTSSQIVPVMFVGVDAEPQFYIGTSTNLGYESDLGSTFLAGSFDPYWQLPEDPRIPPGHYSDIIGLWVTSSGGSATLTVTPYDKDGFALTGHDITLSAFSATLERFVPLNFSNATASIRVKLVPTASSQTNVKIHRLVFLMLDGGQFDGSLSVT